MSETFLLKKTQTGEDEIGFRMLKLPVRLRSVLIAVDGKKSAAELAKTFAAMGDVPAMLAELEQKGCIERVPVARAADGNDGPKTPVLNIAARSYAAENIYRLLGPDSESLVRRIEKCNSNEDLSKLYDECRDLLVGLGKRSKAEEFWGRARELLS